MGRSFVNSVQTGAERFRIAYRQRNSSIRKAKDEPYTLEPVVIVLGMAAAHSAASTWARRPDGIRNWICIFSPFDFFCFSANSCRPVLQQGGLRVVNGGEPVKDWPTTDNEPVATSTPAKSDVPPITGSSPVTSEAPASASSTVRRTTRSTHWDTPASGSPSAPDTRSRRTAGQKSLAKETFSKESMVPGKSSLSLDPSDPFVSKDVTSPATVAPQVDPGEIRALLRRSGFFRADECGVVSYLHRPTLSAPSSGPPASHQHGTSSSPATGRTSSSPAPTRGRQP
ncbi:hypothetical protein IFM53868_02406 [Aspergillus udagawae]|uniref:Uncharacterized protein n=1 Tax=Aspergillus udagawae TaxID=91492 RepID=A0ABQ1AFG6_9EURO|nr:hypothetical protein IFM53868_02406 [Aspergillus udagawae]